MKEIERIEAQAVREAVLLGGGRAELAGGAVCFTHPLVPIMELNRAMPVGEHVDVQAIAAWFDGAHAVSTNDDELQRQLEDCGYTPGRTWMKFERDGAPAATVETDLEVCETLDAELFARVSGEGSGIPLEASGPLAAIVGAPGWRCFVAWAGAEPAASGALYVDGPSAWVGIGSTRPDFRRRGAQAALLAARIARARELGVTQMATETGELLPGKPSSSYSNILRAGFREAYLRPNWRSPERLT